jgi:hypothetical protein
MRMTTRVRMTTALVEAIFTVGWNSKGIIQVREGLPPGSTLVGLRFLNTAEVELAFLLPEGVIAPAETEVKLAIAMLVAAKPKEPAKPEEPAMLPSQESS